MASLRLPNPLFRNGPVEINPLNIATISPVPLIIRLSMGVKASIRGVNKTPPPIPAITAIIAMAKLSKKNPKVKRAKLFRDIPPGGVSAPFDMNTKAIYERATTTHSVVNSSQGDLSSFFILCFPYYYI